MRTVLTGGKLLSDYFVYCTNQQLPQRGGVVPDPIWV